jgi:tripartite-type tricarboxylate transporter receptor subunit TctC
MLGANARIAFAIARKAAALLSGVVAAIIATHSAGAETTKFPNRPIQLIVPYAAGGAVDQTARFLQQGLEKRLGQNVLVINRPGASTTLGTLQAARAAPDGHTIVMVSLPHVSNYTLLKEMPYAQSDFIPITTVTNQWSVLVVNPSLPLKTLSDVIAYVKARPGEVNYGTFGVGTSAHLAALLFQSMIGAKMQAVHYRGGAPTAVGVMTGEVQMAFGTALSAGGGIAGGQLRAIAVTSEKRLVLLPDVPTAREQGLDYVHGSWFGILAPARTPDPIIRQLYDAIKETMAQPDVQKPIRDAGNEVWVTSPAEFARFISEETKLWAGVLKGMSTEQQ